MSQGLSETYPILPFDEAYCVGEGLFADISRDVAKDTNKKVSRAGDNEYVFLNDEIGEHRANQTRFRDSAKQGFLTAYVRTKEFTEDHQTITKITLASVAVGAVIAGVAAMRHKNNKS